MRRLDYGHGKVETPTPQHLIIATDGGYKPKRIHSSAYLTTAGEFGITASQFVVDRCQPHCVIATELRAAYHGLKRAGDVKATLMMDSTGAIEWVQRWQEGDTRLPAWYTTVRSAKSTPTFRALQEELQQRTTELEVVHVQAHSGNLLNEAADALVGIGIRCVTSALTSAEARERASGVVTSFLLSHNQQQAN